MKEVTTRANRFMHPKDADIGKMLCFSGDKVGDIRTRMKAEPLANPGAPIVEKRIYFIEWSDAILSMEYETLEELITKLETTVKFYHL